eukprot:CAMPEP_0202900478 /NCGR_PEP_ID=MMETSP1392-20130828/11858_1 /ASSEMBLY_ACC=CAM_ASM_000868 /TAXON_ID=225041 /ORGANISM="Chlamydomonas chlamydogama, Strain SAG 11-48b" /LENGTH=202 /DNA_ID=CAMNT_0049586875 /DNA_START=69 /DNA_END=677 /DNA_ORIENTATION=-
MALRGAPLRQTPFTQTRSVKAASSRSLVVSVEANKRVSKKTKVILVKESPLGKEGDIKSVPLGYWRNYLAPSGIAKIADDKILAEIRRIKEEEIRKKLEVKAQAQAFANALTTIGKFIIKKKVGDKDQIFGSVSIQEISDAIYQQTGRDLSEMKFTVPEIKAVGTYECQVELHPEVTGTFSVVIQKEKNVQAAKATDAKKKK